MRHTRHARPLRRALLSWLLALLAVTVLAVARAQQPAAAGSAAALLAKRGELAPQLRSNVFGEPLVLASREGSDHVEGDVYADVAQPWSALAETFRSAAALCELLFLHPNVRACAPAADTAAPGLDLRVGPKRAGAGGSEVTMHYAMRVEVADARHLRVVLTAAEGPLSTRDYRMVFEAVPIDERRSFVHLGYAYSYGLLTKMAMGVYLATAGRDKIGFSIDGKDADGRPQYVKGERAATERNVMRYYLALLAHRSVTTGTPEERMQARLRAWFALTERYAAQLREYDLDIYLQEKRDDLERAKTGR
jgi:hypothetical protein